MKIKKIHLINFRNYINEEINFSDNVSLIYGENAQGKTNIVEALYLFSTGKSHRTNNTNELVRHGESYFSIMLEFEDNNYLQSMEIKYEKGNRKRLFINEVKKDRLSDILGVIPSVLFSPESLSCIKGSPGERRKIIDIVLCQVSKKYLYNLQKYNRIVKNKNVLLKKIKNNKQYSSQLDVWNESQAKTGTVIIEERRSLILSLEKRMKRLMHGISDGKEDVKVRYRSLYEENKSIYENFLNLVSENKNREIEQEISLFGPHRDEIEILLNNQSSRLYCSQGQQRSLALSLSIAIMEEIEERTGKIPILLLDDVMSELDEKRRNYLYELIGNNQAVITSTDKMHFKTANDDKVSYIEIKNGTVVSYTNE
ncbi:MAG: DNA replication/repair protein RecF [Clostridiaceae bacterium]|nr:DNA replication/repair protein RecF [Clostridiaceae bacterium]